MKIPKKKLDQLITEEVAKLHKELGLEENETNQGLAKHKSASKSKKKHNNGVGDLWGDGDSADNGDAGDGGDGGMAESIVEEIYNLFAEQIEEQL